MSIKAMTWAWELIDLPSRETLVLLSLADQANDKGVCWPSIRLIAERARCTKRTVYRTLANLEDLGLIEIKSRGATSGRKTSLYRLNVGAEFSAEIQQSDILSPCGKPDEGLKIAEDVDNPIFPQKSSKVTFCHHVDKPVVPSDTGVTDGDMGVTGSDTGVTLLPIKEPSINPNQSKALDVENRRSGSRIQRETSILAECVPSELRSMLDATGAKRVRADLEYLTGIGWKPGHIRQKLNAKPIPERSMITNPVGLVIQRVSDLRLLEVPSAQPKAPPRSIQDILEDTKRINNDNSIAESARTLALRDLGRELARARNYH